MKIESVEFLQLDIPFKGIFAHGKKQRSSADTILVKIGTAQGHAGWGEILARPYVTGETNSDILDNQCAQLANEVIGMEFQDEWSLQRWILTVLPGYKNALALFGGIEMALWDALCCERPVEFEKILGPKRKTNPENCVTIGFDASAADMRGRVIDARMKRANVVKLKVGQMIDRDVERLRSLHRHTGNAMRIRLDGNRTISLTDSLSMLSQCSDIPIESFEEPLNNDKQELVPAIQELHEKSGVDIMADESVCSMEDAEYYLSNSVFQAVNIRLGKNGGLVGSARLRDYAASIGIGIVGGSMVGESGVLTLASMRFLEHSEKVPYIEGLGQNERWLTIDPVQRGIGSNGRECLQYKDSDCKEFIRTTRHFS